MNFNSLKDIVLIGDGVYKISVLRLSVFILELENKNTDVTKPTILFFKRNLVKLKINIKLKLWNSRYVWIKIKNVFFLQPVQNRNRSLKKSSLNLPYQRFLFGVPP
jgi:hypothetical protein